MDGGGGERGVVFKIVSAIWRGRRREEGGGMRWSERNTRTKKGNTGINKRPGHFLSYMYWTGTKKNYHGGGGFVTGSLRSVLMGVWVKAGRGHKGNKGGGKPSVRDVGTVRGVGLKITMGKT